MNEFCANDISLKQFRALLTERLPSLGHIQVNAVKVVDHLGRIVPIPTVFCSTWEVIYSIQLLLYQLL